MGIHKMPPLTVLRKANQNQKIEESFDINLGGTSVSVKLTAPDIFTIMKDQERCYQKEYAICVKDGMGSLPVNEADWQKDLERIDDPDVRIVLEKDKPINLAQQVAKKNARFDTIRVLLPKILRDQETGELIGKTPEEQAEVGEYIIKNPGLMTYLTEKYVSIINKINEASEAVKNLPQQGDLTSGDSKKPLQDGTDTGDRSTRN